MDLLKNVFFTENNKFFFSIFSLKFSKKLFFQLKLCISSKPIELSSILITTLHPLMSGVLCECISRRYLICNYILFAIGPLCIPKWNCHFMRSFQICEHLWSALRTVGSSTNCCFRKICSKYRKWHISTLLQVYP